MPRAYDPTCVFCRIIAGEENRKDIFWEDDVAIGLLDIRPLKPGHALLIPKDHYVTLKDLPTEIIGPLFIRAARLNRAVEVAFSADGSFSGYNTHVSQSVDHFHLHVVPRTFGDKLFAGGKWVRIRVKDAEAQRERRDHLAAAMTAVMAGDT